MKISDAPYVQEDGFRPIGLVLETPAEAALIATFVGVMTPKDDTTMAGTNNFSYYIYRHIYERGVKEGWQKKIKWNFVEKTNEPLRDVGC